MIDSAHHIEPAQEHLAPGPSISYRFGSYILDASRRVLFHELTAKPLSEKLFKILLLLLQADGRVVSKDTFFDEVWPDQSPSDANLAQHLLMLRQILGERARDHSYVVTVPGIGYRLATTVERKIGLSMKQLCERCDAALEADGRAYICSYECTFCESCAMELSRRCRNCGGTLVRRPPRRTAAAAAEQAG